MKEIYALDGPPSFVAASGSLPEGVPDDFFARLSLLCKERGSKLIIDTSGPALIKAVEEGVFMVKPNLTELCTLVGKEYLDFSEIEDAAREVINKGKCEVIVVSMGPKGAMLVTKDELIKVNAPTVKKLSTSGAGDSMIAGIVYMLEQNKSMLDAVRFGVACGTAATMNTGTRLFEKEQALKLYEWIKNQ
jgi:6-phosphofructokinase 2